MMSIYLKHTMDALQILVITKTTDISNNSAIGIITSGIIYINKWINRYPTIGNKIKQIVI